MFLVHMFQSVWAARFKCRELSHQRVWIWGCCELRVRNKMIVYQHKYRNFHFWFPFTINKLKHGVFLSQLSGISPHVKENLLSQLVLEALVVTNLWCVLRRTAQLGSLSACFHVKRVKGSQKSRASKVMSNFPDTKTEVNMSCLWSGRDC